MEQEGVNYFLVGEEVYIAGNVLKDNTYHLMAVTTKEICRGDFICTKRLHVNRFRCFKVIEIVELKNNEKEVICSEVWITGKKLKLKRKWGTVSHSYLKMLNQAIRGRK